LAPDNIQRPRIVGRSGRRLARLVGLVSLLPLCACTTLKLPSAAFETVEPPVRWESADALATNVDSAGTGADTGTGAGAATVDAVSLVSWWRRFDDPQLVALVELALAANASVLGAQAASSQAQALRVVAAAALWPQLGSSASARRATVDGDSTGNSFQAGLDAIWAPDVFGAALATVDASDAAVRASAASLGDVQVQISAEVAMNYILLRSAQARLVIAGESLSSQLETLQITRWREQAGLVTALDSEQARAAAAQTRAALPVLQTSISQTGHALSLLTGQPPAALKAQLAAAGPLPQTGGALVMSIPAETLRQRADVRAAELQVAAALARLGQAEAQRWPTFSIGGSLSLSALTLGALTNGASVLGSLLASVNWPVIDGGAARARMFAQQAALAQARQVYRAAVLGALRDVEDALAALQGDRLRLASLDEAAAAANVAVLLARQRYSSGLVDFQVVLETQRAQITAQDSQARASADVSGDQVRLFKALGGGWRVKSVVAVATPVIHTLADTSADISAATTVPREATP